MVNRDIIQMVRAKVDDATILEAIKTSPTNFDISGSGLTALKNARVSEGVIRAMIEATNKPEPAQTAEPQPSVPNGQQPPHVTEGASERMDLPDEMGVYFRGKGKLVPIEPEIANWKTGGVAKKIATLGLDHGHIDGTIRNAHSPLDLTAVESSGSLEFLVPCADGESASEYQLLNFWVKSDRREFRTVTGGVLHASGGAQDNVRDFTFEKVAPHSYRIVLTDLRAGEYGFLAPTTTASLNAASQGKAYTFRIKE